MPRLLIVLAFLGCCLAPRDLAGQQAAFGQVPRLVGAIRIAAMMSAPPSSPRAAERHELFVALPPLAAPSAPSRRRVLRLSLTERLQFRASTYWLSSGLTGTIGLGVRF